jgi:hypothetical protein
MTRITIKSQNQAYFQALQIQMECSNPTEALNHLLMDLKRRGYSFLEGMEYVPAYTVEALPEKPQRAIKGKLQPSQPAFIHPENIPEVDPVIARLVAIGLDDF